MLVLELNAIAPAAASARVSETVAMTARKDTDGMIGRSSAPILPARCGSRVTQRFWNVPSAATNTRIGWRWLMSFRTTRYETASPVVCLNAWRIASFG